MRAGVLESLHAGILLKEYGRLDKAFDAGLQVVIEILQDEGIYNGDGETVVKVIGKALEEVSRIANKVTRVDSAYGSLSTIIWTPTATRNRQRRSVSPSSSLRHSSSTSRISESNVNWRQTM